MTEMTEIMKFLSKNMKQVFLLLFSVLIISCSDKEQNRSQLEVCQSHYKAESYLVAVKECEIAANQDISEAQWILAHIYRYDLNKEGADIEKAFSWYLSAAELGHVEAMREVGTAYLFESGVAKDYEKAFLWLSKAAKFEDTLAEFSIGTMYFNGDGREKDIASAINWFKRAAVNGHPMSINNLAWIFATSRNKAFYNPKKANYWVSKMNSKMSEISMFIDTQAAVKASLGEFEEAIRLQNLAIAALPEDTPEQELLEYQKHLESYQNNEAWNE